MKKYIGTALVGAFGMLCDRPAVAQTCSCPSSGMLTSTATTGEAASSTTSDSTSYAIYGSNTGTGTVGNSSVRGEGAGVYGVSAGMQAYGVFGLGPNGAGVFGWGPTSTGVVGYSGNAFQGNGGVPYVCSGKGVCGVSESGTGIYGSGTTGVEGTGATGVWGLSGSTSGQGVYGYNNATTAPTTQFGGVGVFGSSLTSYGVAGQSTLASGAVSGVYGTVVASNTSGVGVAGAAYVGVQGTGTGAGVTGYSPSSGYGIQGISQSGDAVYGASNGNGNGLHGITAGAASGVYGVSTYTGGTSYGVYGSSPSYGVWGTSTGSSVGVVGSATGSGSGIYGQNSNSSGWSGYFNGYVNVATCLKVNGTNYGSCTSDARLKKNVEPLTGSLEKITRLRPVTFEWKEPDEHNGTGRQVGFIAQDVEKVLPEWVGANDKGFKTVNRGGLDVMLVDSVRTLKMENDDLRIRSASLEDRVRSLEAGRRPLISGMGEGGIGLGMLALAGALVFTKRKRTEV